MGISMYTNRVPSEGLISPSELAQLEAAQPLSAFPRPTPTFVGRQAELARAESLITEETLHFVYGMAGIGKTEFCYALFERLRHVVSLAPLPPVLVAGQCDSAEHLLRRVLVAAGGTVPVVQAGASAVMTVIAALAERLETAPRLVLLDDIGGVPASDLAAVLVYLSRRVRASRLVVTSRQEIALGDGAAVAVIHRLGPLDRTAVAELVTKLANRLGATAPNIDEIMEQTGGSPLLVVRAVVGSTGQGGYAATLSDLSPQARELLLMCALSKSELATSELVSTEMAPAYGELTARFLLDEQRGRLVVPHLVRKQCEREASRRDLVLAHRMVADLLSARMANGRNASDAIAVVHHLVAAGEAEEAWELIGQRYRDVAAAGIDHHMIDDLRVLIGALSDRAAGDAAGNAHAGSPKDEAQLLLARILVRRSHIAAAAEVLATLGDRGERAGLRWLLLSGEVAQRRGRLHDAAELFRRAKQMARTDADQFIVALSRADVASMAGHGDAAREILTEVYAATGGHLPDAQRGRWGWSLTLSYLLQARFPETIAAARSATEALAGPPSDDRHALVAALEVLARAECDEVEAGHAVLQRFEPGGPGSGALRAEILRAYQGVMQFHAGNLIEAAASLDVAYGELGRHTDHVIAALAGYYRARVALTQGQSELAIDMAARVTHAADAAELESLAPTGRALQAEALLLAGRVEEARSLAQAVLTAPRLTRQCATIAGWVLAEAAALDGDIDAGRAYLDEHLGYRPQPATLVSNLNHTTAQEARDAEKALLGGWMELLSGDLNRAGELAAAAAEHYRRAGRRAVACRARLIRALTLVARGGSSDLSEAEVHMTASEGFVHANADQRCAALLALLRAALAKRRSLPTDVHLEPHPSELWHTEGRIVRAARGQAEPPPGVRGLLTRLGLLAGVRHKVTTRDSTRIVGDDAIAAVRAAHRLVVEPTRAVITARVGDEIRIDRGRPLACELLAVLIETQGTVIAAEQLFLAVWRAREYHPLRHRNTLYVAVKRLRTTLANLLGDERELIETASGGWRIVDDLDAVVIRPDA